MNKDARYLTSYIEQDLQNKMVFVGGPRQVGKTTLSQSLLAKKSSGLYFNWDFDADRANVLAKKWLDTTPMLVFDELHKYPNWKQWVKGLYDVRKHQHQILVTGSARLDVYQQGGDSLLGRYHYWRLHPFTLDELPSDITAEEGFDRLMRVGGFPEPFLSGSDRLARRWRNERFDRVLQEDIRDLENVKNIQQLRLLVDLLKTRVGGTVVASNLAQDIQVSPPTVKAWIEALERMYLLFTVYPYTQASVRSLQKPPKVYFYDNADVVSPQGDAGARFENLVATHLLKRIQFVQDYEGYRCELRYIRDREDREVDFAILRDGKLEALIEVKTGDDKISPSLRYYKERLNPAHTAQIVARLDRPYDQDGIRVTNAIDYFSHNIPWKNSSLKNSSLN